MPTPHLFSWWLDAGVEGEPVFALVLEGDQLLGGAAFQKEPWRGIERFRVMANKFWPAHVDLLAEPERETEVEGALSAWMKAQGSAVFQLRGMVEESRLVAVMPGPPQQRATGDSWCIDLEGDFDSYFRVAIQGIAEGDQS